MPVCADTRLKAFERDVRSEALDRVALTVTAVEFLPVTSNVTVPAAIELTFAFVTALAATPVSDDLLLMDKATSFAVLSAEMETVFVPR